MDRDEQLSVDNGREGPLGAEEVLAGFHEVLRRGGMTAGATVEAASLAYALADVLVGKGLIALDEIDRARRETEVRLNKELADRGAMIRLTEGAPDKYAMGEEQVSIDCASRVELCKAACCRLRFALTEQDLDEGRVHWSIRDPYLNRQRDDGYCCHLDAEQGCGVYASRPAVCRSYDCRDDRRIWIDFEAREVNPSLLTETGEASSAAPPNGRVTSERGGR